MADKLPTVDDFYKYVEKCLKIAEAWSVELEQLKAEFMEDRDAVSLCNEYLCLNEGLISYISKYYDAVILGDNVVDNMAWVEFKMHDFDCAYFRFIDMFNEL